MRRTYELKFNGRPCKTTGHLFCAISSFVHYFKAISEFKLELQYCPETLNSGQNRQLFGPRVNLRFDRLPWKTIGHLFYATWSFVHHSIAICQFKLELQSGNARFGSKSEIFLSCVSLKFDRWPWKTIGHLFYVTSSFVNHFIATVEFKLDL